MTIMMMVIACNESDIGISRSVDIDTDLQVLNKKIEETHCTKQRENELRERDDDIIDHQSRLISPP